MYLWVCMFVCIFICYIPQKLLYVCSVYPLCIYLYLYRCRQLITYSACCIVATEFNFVLMGRTFDRATNSRLSTTPITPYPTHSYPLALCLSVLNCNAFKALVVVVLVVCLFYLSCDCLCNMWTFCCFHSKRSHRILVLVFSLVTCLPFDVCFAYS